MSCPAPGLTGISGASGKTGKIVVFVDSFVFSNVLMGGTFTEPDDRQMMRYNIEFYIFEEVLLTDDL